MRQIIYVLLFSLLTLNIFAQENIDKVVQKVSKKAANQIKKQILDRTFSMPILEELGDSLSLNIMILPFVDIDRKSQVEVDPLGDYISRTIKSYLNEDLSSAKVLEGKVAFLPRDTVFKYFIGSYNDPKKVFNSLSRLDIMLRGYYRQTPTYLKLENIEILRSPRYYFVTRSIPEITQSKYNHFKYWMLPGTYDADVGNVRKARFYFTVDIINLVAIAGLFGAWQYNFRQAIQNSYDLGRYEFYRHYAKIFYYAGLGAVGWTISWHIFNGIRVETKLKKLY